MQAASICAAIAVIAGCSSSHEPVREVPRPAPIVVDAMPVGTTPGLRLPEGVRPVAYDLKLELDPDKDRFAGKVEIRVQLDAPARQVWLHADDLVIDKASYRAGTQNGLVTVAAPTEHEMRALVFGDVVPAGEVTLVLEYTGHVVEDLEGVFRQKFGKRWFLYTQAEATYARRIVPCFDEPRFKVPWRVRVVAPVGLVVAGNAPIEREQTIADKREVTFFEMPALPSHLLAVAVGPFEIVDLGRVGKAAVPARALVAPFDAKRLGAARLWVPKLVDELEAYFDKPLPLAKLDLVAVPRFFGAMENPGLVTFERTALAGDEKSPAFLRRHVRFLAHELAHQWVGNAVTPAWWDDLWLAEAFATWLDDKLSSTLGTLDDAALRTQLARAKAMEADRALTAKPLRRAIASTQDIEDTFDAISYEKGAAVISMFEQYIGEAKFRDIVRAYIKGRSHANANDFIAAFQNVDAPLAQAFAAYLDRAGAPVVDMARDGCSGKPHVVVTPRDGAAVPVCIRHAGGKSCALATGRTEIPVAACNGIVGNADGRGYYEVQWQTPQGVATAAKRARGDVAARRSTIEPPPTATVMTAAELVAHGQDRAAAIARGELASDAALAEVDALLTSGDGHAHVAAIAMLVELNRFVGESDAPAWGRTLATKLAKHTTRVFDPRTPLEHAIRDQIVELVPPAQFQREVTTKARALVDRALRDGPMSLRQSDFVLAIALSNGGKPLFEKIVTAAAKNTAFLDEWFEGLGYFDASLAPRAVELVLDKRFEPDRAWTIISGMLSRTPTRAAAWRAVNAKLGELLATYGVTEATTVIEATASLCDTKSRAELPAAFAPHLAAIPDGKRALDQSLAAIDRCITASGAPTTRPGQ